MPFTRCTVPACRQVVPMSSISFFACQFAHEMRTLPGTPKDMCTVKSLHVHSRQQYFMVASKRRTVRGLGSRARGAVRSFSVFEHRRLRCFALAVERHPLFINVQFLGQPAEMTCGVFIAATGSYRGRKVVRRAASCALLDRDVCKFVTSRDTFRGCTGVMSIAKTRGMRSCICHALCHVVGNIIIGQTRSVCEVRCRRIPRRDTP